MCLISRLSLFAHKAACAVQPDINSSNSVLSFNTAICLVKWLVTGKSMLFWTLAELQSYYWKCSKVISVATFSQLLPSTTVLTEVSTVEYMTCSTIYLKSSSIHMHNSFLFHIYHFWQTAFSLSLLTAFFVLPSSSVMALTTIFFSE